MYIYVSGSIELASSPLQVASSGERTIRHLATPLRVAKWRVPQIKGGEKRKQPIRDGGHGVRIYHQEILSKILFFMTQLATKDTLSRRAYKAFILAKNWKWTRQRVKAANLVADNRLMRAEIAKECGVTTAGLNWWLRVPEFQKFVERRIEETRKILAERYVAVKEQRIGTYIDDFVKTDRVMDKRAADPEIQAVPGGETGIVLKNGEIDEGLLRQRNTIRKMLAEELGQSVQKFELKDLREMDPRQWSTAQLNVLLDALTARKLGTNDPVTIARKRIELGDRTVVIPATAEVVNESSGDKNRPERVRNDTSATARHY